MLRRIPARRATALAGLTALLATATGAGLTAPASAAPVCYDPALQAACGGRVVAEAENSTTFLQFDTPAESLGQTLEAIEALPGAARYLEVMTMAEATKEPTHKSFGGRPLWVVRVTDEQAPRDGKRQSAISLSVHGLEAAGREGGVRYIEDLARAAQTPEKKLYAGDIEFPFSQVMEQTESWIAFTNSDGWAAGDVGRVGGFKRANDAGKDLNRDLATVGWYDRTGGRGIAESEPETRAWTTLVESLPNLKTSADIHGELTTPNGAFSDLIIPAGEWSPERQEQVDQFSLRMIRTVERKFDEDGVSLEAIFGLPNDDATPRRPANVAASYDIVGYDDSGFMGDWFSQTQDSVHMDVENFLSNLAPNNAYAFPIEQAHVASVRGNIEATIVEALVTDGVRPRTSDLGPYGQIAYVIDGNRVKSSDGTQAPVVDGETQVEYDVSRMDYFPIIADQYDATVVGVTAEQIATGADLSSYDTVVVTDMAGPPAGSSADPVAYRTALDDFATAGGQLVLTDRALGMLDDLGVVSQSALTLNRTDAGHVDFVGELGDHPYESGLVGKPSQTYYEVMLGYPSRNRTPNYGVQRGAWEDAGGVTVATVGPQGSSSSPNTALGTIERGEGQITIFGAILPQAIEKLVLEDGTQIETPHPFGLASYAVTITGGQVLDNVFAFDRNGAAPMPEPVIPEVPLTALLPVAALVMLGLAWRLRTQTA